MMNLHAIEKVDFLKRNNFSIFAGQIIAFIGIYTLPYNIGNAIESYGLSVEDAGWIGTLEVLAIALTSVVLSFKITSLPWKKLAIAGALLFVIGSFGSAAFHSLNLFLISRILCGIGAGMVNSVIAAYIATTINPERMFGLVYVWMSLAYAVLLYFLPAISTAYGGDSLYIVTAMIVLLCIPFLFILPQKINAVIEINKSVEPKSNNLSLLLIVTTLSFLTYGGVYAFSERVAAELSLSAEQMGSAFGLSTIAAIAGAWFTSWAGLRWGRKTPLIGAVLLAGLSYVLILSGGTIFTFFLGMLLYGLMSMVFNSYIYGTAAAVDPSGKTATIIVGYSLIPYSLGSCVIGSIANKWPYHLLGYPALVINIIAILILLPVLYKVDRKTSSLSNDSIG